MQLYTQLEVIVRILVEIRISQEHGANVQVVDSALFDKSKRASISSSALVKPKRKVNPAKAAMQLTPLIRGVLVGTMLGDASIERAKSTHNARLRLDQSLFYLFCLPKINKKGKKLLI